MKIRGNTVGTPMKRPDFNQTDPRKSDYIRNNPIPPISGADEGKVLLVQDGKLAFANYNSSEGYTEGLEYTLSSDGTYYICTGGDVEGDIRIPPEHNGLPVKEIGEFAFFGDIIGFRKLTSVIIPDTVERIGQDAFSIQWSLKEIILKGTPQDIGYDAFASNKWYDIMSDGNGVVPIDIYVPFKEWEVASAPWGAEHGTIHYNSPKSKGIEARVTMLEGNVTRNSDMIMAMEYAVDELERNMESLTTEATDLLNLINEGGLE